MLGVAAIVVAAGLAGWFGTRLLLGGETDGAVAPTAPGEAGTVASSDVVDEPETTSTTVTDTTDATADVAAACADYAEGLASLTADLGDSLAALNAAEVVGPGGLAFAEGYERSVEAGAEGLDLAACDQGALDAAYTSQLASVSGPSSDLAQNVLTMATPMSGVTVSEALSTVVLYQPTPLIVTPTTATDSLPTWISILASLETDQWTEAEALAEADRMAGPGVETHLLLSDDYASLNGGYWVVYVGTYDSRGDANSFCGSGPGAGYDICYDRYLQQLPAPVAPFEGCGEWGSHTIVGGAATVRTGPSGGHRSIGSYPNGATGVLKAGPDISSSGDLWSPVVIAGTIGWMPSEQLQLEAECVGARNGFSVLSCADASGLLVDELRARVEHADARGGVHGEVPPLDAPWESYIAGRASILGCDVSALDAQIKVGLASISPVTDLGRAVLALFQASEIVRG